jgi:hypothetical protein
LDHRLAVARRHDPIISNTDKRRLLFCSVHARQRVVMIGRCRHHTVQQLNCRHETGAAGFFWQEKINFTFSIDFQIAHTAGG